MITISKDRLMYSDPRMEKEDWTPIDGLSVWPDDEDCGITREEVHDAAK